jgi:signal transduction histidine kinase
MDLVPKPPARLLAAALLVAGTAGLAVSPTLPPTTLRQGSVLFGDETVPPPREDPRWAPVALPDPWREKGPEAVGFAWYRLSFPGPARPHERWAVLLPRLEMNAAVLVNGEPIGTGGRFSEPVAHNFNRPLYFVFPSALLDRAENEIHVRLFAYHFGQLGPVEIGLDSQLRPRYERLYFQQIRLAEIATVLSVLTLLFIGSLWLGTRFDPVYGWFTLATAFWTLTGLNYWVRDIPVPHWTWERVVNGGIELFVVALAFWMHRLLGLRRPRVERALLGFATVSIVLLAWLPPERFYATATWLHAVSLGIGAYPAVEVARRLGRFGRWEAVAYVLGGVLCLAIAANDLTIQLGWRGPDAPYLLPLMIPFVLLAFGTTLVARFVSSLGRAEQLGRELEGRVREKHAELEASYARQRDLERSQLLAGERERIMREMHDGLGGQLVSALAMVERGAGDPAALAAALRSALDDMRLVIDSLDPDVHGLDELLGMLRLRLEPLLRGSGMRFAWQVGDLPAPPGWGADEYLHVLRIVQEAVTNVVKHAGAEVVTLAATHGERGISIEIRDDGCGVVASGGGGGRGIPSMQRRAQQLGGMLRVSAAEPGTRVELILQLD